MSTGGEGRVPDLTRGRAGWELEMISYGLDRINFSLSPTQPKNRSTMRHSLTGSSVW